MKQKKQITQQDRETYATIGRLGGRASFKKRGKKKYSEMGKKGMAIRWAKKRAEAEVQASKLDKDIKKLGVD